MIINGLPSGARLSNCAFRGAAELLELLSLLDDEGAFRRLRAVDIMWLSKDKLAAGCFIFCSFWTMGTRLCANRGKPRPPRTVECSRQTFTDCPEKSRKKALENVCYVCRKEAAHDQAAAVYCAPSQYLILAQKEFFLI